ncbi:MAG: alpha/beta hydrolase [Anaerolineae bacterium]
MTRKALGGLILHGFTSSLDCVRALVPVMERYGLPYRMPVLRGHGTRWEDLRGVRWPDWVADAEDALKDLLEEADAAIVMGLSMGGLVALQLAMEHGEEVAGIVGIATALRLNNPLAPGGPLSFLRPLVAKVLTSWPVPPNYADKELEKFDTNYPRAPMDAINSLLEFGLAVEARLGEVHAPALILQSHRDPTVKPESAQIIYDRIASEDKELVWFHRTHHEMLRDVEREAVVAEVDRFVARLVASRSGGERA